MTPVNKPDPDSADKSAVKSEPSPQSSKPPGPSPSPRKRRVRLIVVGALFLAIVIVAVVYFFRLASPYRSTDDAYVHGNQIFLTPRVTGTVVAINADDTDLVRKGQPLVVLDDNDAKVQLQQAEATLGDSMRKVRQFYANVVQMKAKVQARSIELAKAEDDYHRRTAVRDGSVSLEDITHAQQAVDAARATLQAADQQLTAARALVAGTDLEHHPAVLQAKAGVLNADLALQRTVINAPTTGYVARRTVQIGQRVVPGTPLLTIIPLNEIWVDANFREEELKNVRIGQPVTLTADFYGGSVKYKGRVAGLGAGTGAAFALLPPQEASGNWIKIVQRVPVRIVLKPKQLEKFPLRLGLSMRAVIDTHDRRGAVLARVPVEQPVYTTGIYSNEWTKANELVQSLVAKNLNALTNLTGQVPVDATAADRKTGVAHE